MTDQERYLLQIAKTDPQRALRQLHTAYLQSSLVYSTPKQPQDVPYPDGMFDLVLSDVHPVDQLLRGCQNQPARGNEYLAFKKYIKLHGCQYIDMEKMPGLLNRKYRSLSVAEMFAKIHPATVTEAIDSVKRTFGKFLTNRNYTLQYIDKPVNKIYKLNKQNGNFLYVYELANLSRIMKIALNCSSSQQTPKSRAHEVLHYVLFSRMFKSLILNRQKHFANHGKHIIATLKLLQMSVLGSTNSLTFVRSLANATSMNRTK